MKDAQVCAEQMTSDCFHIVLCPLWNSFAMGPSGFQCCFVSGHEMDCGVITVGRALALYALLMIPKHLSKTLLFLVPYLTY